MFNTIAERQQAWDNPAFKELTEEQTEVAASFVRAIEAGEPDATPAWAGVVLDYDRARALGIPYADSRRMPTRANTVAEALYDALDYTKGPMLTDVVKVLSMAMKGTDPVVALAARQLVGRAAAKGAWHNEDDE